MISFVLAAAALTLVAVAFVLVPLFLRRPADAESLAIEASNLALARAQRDEVLGDHAAGLLSDAEREDTLGEIARRLSHDLEGQPTQPVGGGRGALSRGVKSFLAVLILGIPLSAGLLYWKTGTPDALLPRAPGTDVPATEQQIIAMVDSLTEKMQARPDDAQGWSLLARSQAAIGRFDGAARSYARLNQLQPGDPDILADYAEVIAMTQQESFEGKPWELVQQALKVNPDQRKALAIAGTTELRRRNLQAALGHWERLLKLLPADSADARQVSSAILEVRLAMTGSAGMGAPQPLAGAAVPPSSPPAAISKQVAGSVAISPDMAKLAGAGDTLFIFARAVGPNAPRMPLAIIRASVSELPRLFELSDSMAMAPNIKLSDFPQVTIEARVSKSGNAIAQPGDLSGVSVPVKPGATGIKVVIDRVVK